MVSPWLFGATLKTYSCVQPFCVVQASGKLTTFSASEHEPMAAATTCSHDKLPEPLMSVNLSRYDPQSSPATFPNVQLYLHLSQWMSAKPPVQTQSPKPPLLRFCLCLGHPRRVPPLRWAARDRPGAPRRHRCARRLLLKRDIVTLFFCAKNVCACKNDLKIHHESPKTIHSRNYTKYYVHLCAIFYISLFVP